MKEPQPRPAAPSPNSKQVGKRLAIIREELDNNHGEAAWTQAAVAKRIGLTQNIVWRIE